MTSTPEELRAHLAGLQQRLSEVTRERDALAARLDALGDDGPGSKRAAWVAEWQRAQLAEAERDALAAQLAALREAATRVECRACHGDGWLLGVIVGPDGFKEHIDCEACAPLRAALADTAPAAEAYTRSVRAEAFTDGAARLRHDQLGFGANVLDTMAAAERRGGK